METPAVSGAHPPEPDVLDAGAAGGRAIRASAIRAAGYVLAAVLSLVSVPLLVRHLGVADFGRYTTVIALIAMIGGLTEGGLTAVAVRELAVREGAARHRLMRDLLGARVALTIAGVGLATAFAAVAGYGTELVLGTVVAGGGLLVGALHAAYSTPLQAQLRSGWVTGGELMKQVVSALLVIAGVLVGAGVLPFLAIPIPTGLLVLALMMWLVRRDVPMRPAFHPRHWVPLIRETLPVAVASAMYAVYFRVVIIVMSVLATTFQTGLFATSYRLIEVLVAIPFMLVTAVFPILARAARDDRERLRYVAGRVLEVAAIGGVWLGLVTALGAETVIAVIAGDEAAGAIPLIRIQAAALTFAFFTIALHYSLLALRDHKPMLQTTGLAFAVTLVLALALVPWLEAEGAAIAATVGEGVLAVASLIAVRLRAPDLLRGVAALPKVLAATALAIAVVLPLDLPEIARPAVASAVYFGVLVALRAIPRELLELIPRRR